MWKARFGRCIYSSPSGFKVHQNYFYRWLTMGSTALQTVINRRAPHKPVLRYLPALTQMVRQYPNPICLLGLGGGGVPLMLNHHTPSITIDVVEISGEIIDIAQKFFMPTPNKNIHLVQQNAVEFLQSPPQKYAHLLVDLYGPNHFPKECADDVFFSACANTLTEDGYFAINLANIKEQWPLFQLMRQHFQNTLVIPVKSCANMVVIASNHLKKETFLEKVNSNKQFKRIMWVEQWGYVAS